MTITNLPVFSTVEDMTKAGLTEQDIVRMVNAFVDDRKYRKGAHAKYQAKQRELVAMAKEMLAGR